MKFSHSQRVYHQVDYNPPCNYYDPKQIKNKSVLSGTLAGAVLPINDRNTFGFQQRFIQNISKSNIPGPAEYFMDKKQIIYQFNKDLSKPKSFLKNTFKKQQPNPSIPYKVLDLNTLNDQQKSFLRQLALLQNTSRAAQNIQKKQPSYSFSKSPRSILPSLQKQKPKHHNHVNHQLQRFNEHKKFQDQNKLNKKQQGQTIKRLILNNQVIKKATKKRNQIINSIGPNFIPSLQLIELMKKMRSKQTPGPGAYCKKQQKSFNDSRQIDKSIKHKEKNTFSNVKRFQKDHKNKIGPGSYNLMNNTYSKINSFVSKQKRILFGMKQDRDLYHRFYIDPSLQSKNTVQPLFGRVQRSNSCFILKNKINNSEQYQRAFGSSSKRFSITSTLTSEQDTKYIVSQYQEKKKSQFKQILNKKIKKLYSEDRYSTKQDSGLLKIQAMAANFD